MSSQSKLLKTVICVSVVVLFICGWLHYQFPFYLQNFFTSIPVGMSTTDSQHAEFIGGDTIQVFYLSWKLKQALLHPGIALVSDSYNFVANSQIFYDMHIGAQFILIALMSFIFGDIGGYNIGFFYLPILLTAIFGYLMLSKVTRSSMIAVLGGIALAIIPYRVSQILGGHSGGAVFALTPLYWWLVFKRQFDTPSRYSSAAWAAVVLFFTVVSDEHQGFYQLLLSGFVFITWGIQEALHERNLGRATVNMLKRWWPLLVGLCAVFVYGGLYNALISSSTSSDEPTAKIKRTAMEIRTFSNNINSYLHTGALNTTSALVYLLLLLAVVLIFFRFKKLRLWLAGPFLGFVLALPILTALMLGIGDHWSQKSGIYQFFYNNVPFFCYQRVASKMMTEVTLLVVLLAAVSWQALSEEYIKAQQKLLKAVLGCVMALGYLAFTLQVISYVRSYQVNLMHTFLERMDVKSPDLAADLIKNTDENSIIMMAPASMEMGRGQTLNQYLAYRTGRRFAGGYYGQPPQYYWDAVSTLASDPFDPVKLSTIKLLQEHGYTHFLVDDVTSRIFYPQGLVAIFEQKSFLEKKFCKQQYCLFRIDTQKMAEIPVSGFHGWLNDTKNGKPGRWMVREWPVDLAINMGYKENDFAVYSQVDFGLQTAGKKPFEIELIFDSSEADFPLWLLQEGRQPQQLLTDSWQRIDGLWHVRFWVENPRFLLASKEYFLGPNRKKYGHFVSAIQNHTK